MRLPRCMLAAALCLLPATVAATQCAVRIPDAHVAAALAAAGENRAELQQVLAHYTELGDAEKLVGARFLIANMPEHGYVLTELRDAKGRRVDHDPLAWPNYEAALQAFEQLEAKHGKLEFARERKVKDIETIASAYLITHIDAAFKAWRACPDARRVGFGPFLDHILPYRGSQEPVNAWFVPLAKRHADLPDGDAKSLYRALGKDTHQRVRFNERYYLHPTDQGYEEMLKSGQGRCEDITNMITYACRSRALATAADYTPYWAHRDNNHAWNVILDADGKGCAKSNAHAAKVYRKTFAVQRESLPFRLPKGAKAANRFMSSRSALDVTDQYREVTDAALTLDAAVVGEEKFAYICVFNGGEWKAVHWSEVKTGGRVVFTRMGRRIAYLPAIFRDDKLIAAGDPFILENDGAIRPLPGTGASAALIVTAVKPRQKSVDTHVVTPVSHLKEGGRYRLARWTREGWKNVVSLVAGKGALKPADLPGDGLYWLTAEKSRRLERIFTIENERQRWW